jgi:pyroglutamyl-peptidase
MTPRCSILLTGFGPFGGYRENSSQRVVESVSTTLRGRTELVYEILPTEFRAAGNRMQALLVRHRPKICICMGLKYDADAVILEKRAQNLDDADIADNAGEERRGQIISPNPPEFFESNLPFEAISAALTNHQIPSRLSDSAGNFVCNHVFYIVAELLRSISPNARFGFIHMPPCAESEPTGRGMPLSLLTLGVCLSVETCKISMDQ